MEPLQSPTPVSTTAPAPIPEPPEHPSLRNLLRVARRRWRSTSLAIRWVGVTIPFIAAAAFFGPKIRLQASAANSESWLAAIQARARVDLQEDFGSGLSEWGGADGSWSLDGMGSARPGRLALYRPSLPLTDYRFEFQGQIESKAMGFVFRAADTKNYYAVKILIAKPGPLSSVALVRYAVIAGEEGPKKQISLPMYFHDDTLYKLLVTVQGEHFTVLINGQLADAWSDDRLKSGGVGFFAEKGEISRLRTVHVVDKEDFLGDLCYQVSRWTADRRTIGVKHE